VFDLYIYYILVIVTLYVHYVRNLFEIRQSEETELIAKNPQELNPTLFTLSLENKETFLSVPYPVPGQKGNRKPFRQLEIKATKNPFPSGYCEGTCRISLPVDFC